MAGSSGLLAANFGKKVLFSTIPGVRL